MARKIDKQSKRQRVFAYLDTVTDRDRGEVVEQIMADFDMGRSYAMTLYQSHRAQSKEAGALTKVYKVRDRKDGKDVAPYMSTKFVATAADSDATDKKTAVTNYEADLTSRIAKAKKL